MHIDISQAYRTVRTGRRSNSLRRFFWFRDINDPDSMIQLMLVRMTFGDVPASGILSECVDLVGQEPGIPPQTKDFIQEPFYVDDGGTSSQYPERLEKI